MAKDITWLGASYSAVPAITLPLTGGGTARFTDTSVTTATASDVLSGKTFVTSAGATDTGSVSFATYYVSSSNPSGGNDGDIWLKTV